MLSMTDWHEKHEKGSLDTEKSGKEPESTKGVLILTSPQQLNKPRQRWAVRPTPWQPLHARAGMQVPGRWLGSGNHFLDVPLVSPIATDGVPRLQKDPEVYMPVKG